MLEKTPSIPQEDSVSRRSFLASAVTAGAVAAIGLAGCSSQGGNTQSANSADLPTTGETNPFINNAPGEIIETRDVDVAVVGAGGSGVACALQAAENGLTALVVEKQSGVGGATLGGIDWIFAINTKYHKEVGLDIFTASQVVAHELANSQYRADGARWLDFVRQSTANIDWIEANGGVINSYMNIDPVVQATTAINVQSDFQLPPLNIEGGANAGCVTPLSEAAQAKGAQFLFNAEVTSLIQNSDGAICGLYAKTKEGAVQINAKAVVLATGGFSANEELLAKAGWDVEQIVPCNMGVETGSGYQLALAAGAQDHIGDAAPMAQWVIEAFPGRTWNDPITGDNGFTLMTKQILVNQNGIRFMNEAVPLANPIMQVLPTKNNQATFTLFDDAIWAEHFKDVEGAAEQLAQALEQNHGESFYRCDTIAQCAEKFGLDAASLQATVDSYNAMCDAGADDDFSKDAVYLQKLSAPFYIGQIKAGMQVYIGGIQTSDRYEVLDDKYEPIPGLYATGVDGCPLYKSMYTVTVGSGTFAHSIYSGRIAADAIAAQIND